MSRISPVHFTSGPADCVIRCAEVADAAQLLRVLCRVDAETENMTRIAGERQSTIVQEEKLIQNALESDSAIRLVAVVDGEIVGSLGFQCWEFWRLRHGGDLSMGVVKDWWGRGIGRKLLEAFIAWADEKGIIRVGLQVAASNESARRLYENLGFVEEGRLRMYRRRNDGTLEDTIQMVQIREK